jgi:hypothetical protein
MTVGRIVLLSVLVGALLGGVAVMIGYRSWHATEQVEQSVTGPDSTHIARVISVHEPGVNGRRYVVVRVGRIAARGRAPEDSGVVWLENARGVAVQWTGPKQLVVQYAGNAFVEGKVPRVGDVRVTYLSVDSLTAIPVPARDTAHAARGARAARAHAATK